MTAYLEHPTALIPTAASAPFTVEAWIRILNNTTADAVIAQYGGSASADRFGFRINLSGQIAWWHGGQGYVLQGNTVIDDGQWHHVAGTRAADGAVRLYVDGVEDTPSPGTDTAGIENTATRIGSFSSAHTSIAGDIDEPAIYSTALSAARIQAHYNAGTVLNATVTPAAVAATTALPAASKSAGSRRTPAVVASTTALPAATRKAGASRSPAVTAATTTLPASSRIAGTGATRTPAGIASITSLPLLTISTATHATQTPVAIASITTLLASTRLLDFRVTPTLTALTSTIPTTTRIEGQGVTVIPTVTPLTGLVPLAEAKQFVSLGNIRPNADGTFTNWSGAFSAIDDDPDAPTDADFASSSPGAASASAFYGLTNMPGGFIAMQSLQVTARIRSREVASGETVTLYAQVFKADATTPLTDEVLVDAVTNTDTAFANTTVQFTGVDPANQTDWDGALLRLRTAYA